MSNWDARSLALSMLAMAAISASAQNAIQSISSTTQAGAGGGARRVRPAAGRGAERVRDPDPPRIAIDLPASSMRWARTASTSTRATCARPTSPWLATGAPRAQPEGAVELSHQLQGNALLVVLENVSPLAAAATSAGEPVHFAESLNRTQLPLKDIDFRRGRMAPVGSSSIWPTTRSASTSSSKARRWSSSSCARRCPSLLRRRLDVTDFGTPVSAVSAFQQGDRVRLVVEPKGNWGAQRLPDRQPVRPRGPPAEDRPTKLTQGPGFSGEKLSLNFQNIEVRALLQ